MRLCSQTNKQTLAAGRSRGKHRTRQSECSRSLVVALSLRDRKRERTSGVGRRFDVARQIEVSRRSRFLSRSDRATLASRLFARGDTPRIGLESGQYDLPLLRMSPCFA